MPETDRFDQPLDQVPLTFVDVETTGLYPDQGDRICEIAIVRYVGAVPVLTFTSLVNPERPVSPEALAVNRLNEFELALAPRFEEIAGLILEVLDGAFVVAHNAPFDLGFLITQITECGLYRPDMVTLDTLELARECFRFRSNRLTGIAAHFGLSATAAHRALNDVKLTHGILWAMVKRGQTPTLGEVLAWTGASPAEVRP